MINQYEVPALIEDAVPELRKPLHQFPAVFHIYDTVTCLSQYTRRQLLQRNYGPAGTCLRLAGRLYERGNQVVQRAITQCFLPVLAGISFTDAPSRIKVYSMMPASLYNQFVQLQLKQLNQ